MASPNCPKCGATLESHANRGWKFFHAVAFGPYDGRSSGNCPLDGMAFEEDGTPIVGSDTARRTLVEAIHGKKREKEAS